MSKQKPRNLVMAKIDPDNPSFEDCLAMVEALRGRKYTIAEREKEREDWNRRKVRARD